jgi:hypothetical protein
MDRSARLHISGRVTYYVGWIALFCGGLAHLNMGTVLFTSLRLTQRNLLEVSIISFLICIASEVRALASTEKELPSVVKKAA